MKKEKKSPRSKILERRRHKESRSRHRKPSSELGERHQKRHRSKSPSSSKRKSEVHKEQETPKATTEVSNTAVKTEFHRPDEAEQDCTSLANFINNKQQMIQELFETICEEKVKTITPDSLKNCPLEELKIMCLEELNRMANAEITYILSGKDPALYVPAGDTDEAKEEEMLLTVEDDTEEHSESGLKGKRGPTPRASPTAEQSRELAASKRQSGAEDHESTSSVTGDTKSEGESDSLELCATQKEIDSLIQEEIMNQTGALGLAQQSKTDLTDMEILELELRARIIRSLLRSHGMDIADEEEALQQKENVGIKEENT